MPVTNTVYLPSRSAKAQLERWGNLARDRYASRAMTYLVHRCTVRRYVNTMRVVPDDADQRDLVGSEIAEPGQYIVQIEGGTQNPFVLTAEELEENFLRCDEGQTAEQRLAVEYGESRTQVARAIVEVFYLYPTHPVESRGPQGLLFDALEKLAPPVAEAVRELGAAEAYQKFFVPPDASAEEADDALPQTVVAALERFIETEVETEPGAAGGSLAVHELHRAFRAWRPRAEVQPGDEISLVTSLRLDGRVRYADEEGQIITSTPKPGFRYVAYDAAERAWRPLAEADGARVRVGQVPIGHLRIGDDGTAYADQQLAPSVPLPFSDPPFFSIVWPRAEGGADE